jgi:hypothetical protein
MTYYPANECQRILESRPFVDEGRGQGRRSHMAHALEHVVVDGLWLELGVSEGRSIDFITSQTSQMVYGFDWFQGLPEAWAMRPDDEPFAKGAFQGRPSFERPNMTLVDGLFQDTLPGFLAAHPGPVAFLHVDCDLYSSTSFALQALRDRFVAGSVIVFDELFNFPYCADHEMKALLEMAATGIEYRYLGHTPLTTAASIQLTRVLSGRSPAGCSAGDIQAGLSGCRLE